MRKALRIRSWATPLHTLISPFERCFGCNCTRRYHQTLVTICALLSAGSGSLLEWATKGRALTALFLNEFP